MTIDKAMWAPTAAVGENSLASSVQAHLGKASRFANGKVRDWSLFFFFRVVSKTETTTHLQRLAAVLKAPSEADAAGALQAFLDGLDRSVAMNADLADPGEKSREPAVLFRRWLKVLTDSSSADLTNALREECRTAGFPPGFVDAAWGEREATRPLEALLERGPIEIPSRIGDAPPTQNLVSSLVQITIGALFDTATFDALFSQFGLTPAAAGNRAVSLGLLGTVLYELLRQLAPSKQRGGAAVLRSEATEFERRRKGSRGKWDPVPINYAFTYSGLRALKIDADTLASFPDVFRQGMAARADRLGDTGPSAPERWEGVLGLDSVHGYFTGGYLASDDGLPVDEKWREQLREEIHSYNNHLGPFGKLLKSVLKAFTIPLGFEIIHIELGEDPYGVSHGQAYRLPYRTEHFGFRDGISQPFVDMGLGDPPPGGGTPSRDRTWTPVATGEIYLCGNDEDGNPHQSPVNALLRQGSTYLVFRKLEQDVAKFRTFLAKQRPKDEPAQEKLAAEFVGRWRNGTSLVQAPDAALELGKDGDKVINDFLYAADDPLGQSCPLSAHVRRANPRDTGGTNDVRRHRILRRSIAYGGPLLPPDELGAADKRGLLFIAANSRIDLQFELIQSVWLNSGELLGQAGLNRCPVTGANSGASADAFLEAGAVAPVTGLPRFVITRGGDYFFAPGIAALKALAGGNTFPPDVPVPFAGFSMGDVTTPALLSEDRLRAVAGRIFTGQNVVRVAMPSSGIADPGGSPMAFVARVADIKKVLANPAPTDDVAFSVAPYQAEVRALSGGADMIVSTQSGSHSDSALERELMFGMLNAAWLVLSGKESVYERIARLTRQNLEMALRRTGPSHHIDIVHDLGAVTAYNVASELFGVPCPGYLSELAMALPFGLTHIGQVEPDWLQAARAGKPDDPALANWQLWSSLMFLDIVANYLQQAEVRALGLQAGREFLTNIDLQIAQARAAAAVAIPAGKFDGTANLLAAFITVESAFVPGHVSQIQYYGLVRMLLLEMMSSAVVVPATLGTVADTMLQSGVDLTSTVERLYASAGSSAAAFDRAVERLLYETWRFNPSVKVLMRQCVQTTTIGSGTIQQGDRIAALIFAACQDPVAFPDPTELSLDPAKRDLSNYLLFGVPDKLCWGRDHLALALLRECFKAIARLQGMKRVAGSAGVLQKFLQVNIGLRARFVSVLPDWPKKPKP